MKFVYFSVSDRMGMTTRTIWRFTSCGRRCARRIGAPSQSRFSSSTAYLETAT
jgi:hypothetical protein